MVGSSGAGKSTLVHLIPRFFDVSQRPDSDRWPQRPRRDARVLAFADRHRHAGDDPIQRHRAEQYRLRADHCPLERIVEARHEPRNATRSSASMPQGYDTVIGERGVKISGGERQRIALARAILKNPPILILDEATSALDTESESLVQSALQNLMSGRTVFVIAHRLSTVRRADRIVVIENGTIGDIGAHEALIQKIGTYRRLYELQFAEAEAPKAAVSS